MKLKIININKNITFLTLAIMLFTVAKVSAQTTVLSNSYQNTISVNNTQNQILPVVTCVDLSYDLFQGLSDKPNDKSVTNLQKYLNGSGYLKASANGYFGPATLSAVKTYQTTNNISNTGRVGPATRKSIRERSCNVSNTASIINSVNRPSPTPKNQRIDSTNQTVSYPQASSTLVTDTKTSIRWVSTSGAVYGLILEDKDGVGVGHITQTVLGDNFDWTVGKVFSSRANADIYVEPGIYRIKVSGSRGTSSTGDQFSGLFTIKGKSLEIDSLNPGTIYANQNSSVALIGRGFDDSTNINFDVNNREIKLKPSFISSDGKVLVFLAPNHLSGGQYSIAVYNTYNSGATSTPSNAVSLTIK